MKIAEYPYPIWPWQQNMGFPWPRLQFCQSERPFTLRSGVSFPSLLMAYEEWGQINKGPVVLVLHGLTGDSHVARHTYQDSPGWWDGIVGYGKAIDLHRYHVISANVLGGSMGSTGPQSLDAEGRPYGRRFPQITMYDMAHAVHHLLADLHIEQNIRVIGGSMGGMLALAYGSLYAEETTGIMAIAAPIAHSPWAIAFHTVSRTAILNDPDFNDGDYYLTGKFPVQGLSVARMANMISYQSRESMERKFGRYYQTEEKTEFQI
ncbi:MAG: alpha/beta fold hydrolase, partial [Firmicutes bacterium]|nr:alpha/beta fold hydrolase [Bacillota bacterium]